MTTLRKTSRLLLVLVVLFGGALEAFAQTPGPTPLPPLTRTPAAPTTPIAPVAPPAPAAPAAPRPPSVPAISAPLVNLQIGNGNERQNLSTAIQIVIVMTLLTLAPSLVLQIGRAHV